jgi:hypothetical protein
VPEKTVTLRFGQGVDQLSAETSLPSGFARRLVNFDVTLNGTLKRRAGTAQIAAVTDAHSLWSGDEALGYYVAGSVLYSFDGAVSSLLVTGLTPNFEVSYALVAEDVYWSNNVQSGVLRGGEVNEPWAPTSLAGPLGQTYLMQPRGTIVRNFKGRNYLVDGRVLWATEPMDYLRVDNARGFMMFESEILLLEPVSGGIFVGTRDEGVRFLQGTDFKQFSLQNADSLVPVRGSGLSVDGAIFDSAGQGAVWLTSRGWVYGDGGGSTKRLTDRQLALPDYESAASLLRESNGIRQILSFAKGGSGSAAASDYLTSDVIRNGVLLV